MLKFVRKFIDWRVKQKILFEYRLQIWFFCNLAIGWLSKFPAEYQYPPNLSTHPFPDYHLASYIKLSNMFNIIIILFLHFFKIQLEILSAFQVVTQKSNSSHVTKCFTQINCTFIQFHHQCTVK